MSRIFNVIVCAIVLCASLSPARGDQLEKLCNSLVNDPSWRVRLQAASVLGKLKSERAIPALKAALSDENPAVRALAAQVLGSMEAKDAESALERAMNDSNQLVRDRARAALDRIKRAEPKPKPPSMGGAVRIEIGGVGSKVRKTPPELTQRLREFITRELEKTPGLSLSSKAVEGYLIDSAITSLNSRTTDRWVEVSCEVSLVVGRLPSRAMVMMTSGGATVQAPKVGYRPEKEKQLQLTALEGAVRGVHENFLAFLKKQM